MLSTLCAKSKRFKCIHYRSSDIEKSNKPFFDFLSSSCFNLSRITKSGSSKSHCWKSFDIICLTKQESSSWLRWVQAERYDVIFLIYTAHDEVQCDEGPTILKVLKLLFHGRSTPPISHQTVPPQQNWWIIWGKIGQFFVQLAGGRQARYLVAHLLQGILNGWEYQGQIFGSSPAAGITQWMGISGPHIW